MLNLEPKKEKKKGINSNPCLYKTCKYKKKVDVASPSDFTASSWLISRCSVIELGPFRQHTIPVLLGLTSLVWLHTPPAAHDCWALFPPNNKVLARGLLNQHPQWRHCRLHRRPFRLFCACSCYGACSSCWAPSFAPCPAALAKAGVCRRGIARALC